MSAPRRRGRPLSLPRVLASFAASVPFAWGEDAEHRGAGLDVVVRGGVMPGAARVEVRAAAGRDPAGLPWRLADRSNRTLARGVTDARGAFAVAAVVARGTAVVLRIAPFARASSEPAVAAPEWSRFAARVELAAAAGFACGAPAARCVTRVVDEHTDYEVRASATEVLVEVALAPAAWAIESLAGFLGGFLERPRDWVGLLRLRATRGGGAASWAASWLLPLRLEEGGEGEPRWAVGRAALEVAELLEAAGGSAGAAGACDLPTLTLEPLGVEGLEREARERAVSLGAEIDRSFAVHRAWWVEDILAALRRRLGLAGGY